MPDYPIVDYPPGAMTSSRPPSHACTRPPTVLIVDDDEYVYGALQAALRGLHPRLLIATTASEGAALALEHRPELAIIDVGLPDLDGYQLTASLRRHGLTETRILILTGHAPDEAAARDAGADALVAKPFSLHQFLDLVREQLGTDTPAEGERVTVNSSSAA
ncbi:MAG: response regulator [Candidatus Limnocylindrales bacterium]